MSAKSRKSSKATRRERSKDVSARQSESSAIKVAPMAWPEFLRWWTIYLFILMPVRLVFGVLLPPLLQHVWHNGSFLHLAQDDQPVNAKVRLVGYEVRYGTHRRETMDIIIPDPKQENLGGDGSSWFHYIEAIFWTIVHVITCFPKAILAKVFPRYFGFDNSNHYAARLHPAVVFFHGGGFTAVDPAIQHHQVTALARNGSFSVYCPAYPWAPEDPHPQQLLSGLRVLKWMSENHDIKSCALCGESAGGTLVTSLAVLLANPRALKHFSMLLRNVYKLTDEDVSEWEYPVITSVTSWYGILDQESWRNQGFLAWGLSWTVDAHRSRAPWPFRSDASEHAQVCDFLTLVEACERGWVEYYPPLLLIAGSTDPLGLVHSSRRAETVLREKVSRLKRLEYAEYEAGHAFIGLNPFILVFLHGDKWRGELALPATYKTLAFIKNGFLEANG